MRYFSFRSLGTIGDMCSQMQQYASLYAVAKENGAEIVLPEVTRNEGFGIRLFDVFDIGQTYQPNEFFKEFTSFELDGSKIVDDRVFSLEGNQSYFIDGRFDLFHYWYPKYQEDVLSWKIHQHLIDDATNYINHLKKEYKLEHLTSIHIRLGDYLLPQHNHFTKLWKTQYYQDAIELCNKEDTLFLAFTNDVTWCKERLMDESEVVFVDTGNDALDFTIMSMCNTNIIANSSYSWWAAFKNMNKDKKVICPTNYLLDYSYFKHINGNYYPSDWISIDIEGG
jgi:hypothetical protein